VTCVSAEDAAALCALVPELTPVLVPNGIDVEEYTEHATRITQHVSAIVNGPPSVVFTGKMDYRPNVDAVLWFARQVWPHIRARRPEARFVVVGQKPTGPVQALDGRDGIEVTGAVDDARPFIAGTDVYVAPLRMGGGTRFKLLEAMALARPVVATTIGAEGFPVQPGRELLVADSPVEFARAVLGVLDDAAQAQALGRAGRAFVQAHYDWSVIIPALEASYS
jgi:glycosyltransferase involved in cell wall biosynthesis